MAKKVSLPLRPTPPLQQLGGGPGRMRPPERLGTDSRRRQPGFSYCRRFGQHSSALSVNNREKIRELPAARFFASQFSFRRWAVCKFFRSDPIKLSVHSGFPAAI